MQSDNQVLEVIVGLLWGDEAKAKVLKERAERAKRRNPGKRTVVARFNGCDNAGHTNMIINRIGRPVKFPAHMTTGGLVTNSDMAIGPDVGFNPISFLSELDLAKKSIDYEGRILISERAGVLFNYHREIDRMREKDGGGVGTTIKGNGPVYEDNARRTTRLTFADYLSARFPERLREVLELKKSELVEAGLNLDTLFESICAEHIESRERLKGTASQLEYELRNYLDRGDNILLEGAQGNGLDVSLGDLPNVTSSHVLAPHGLASLALPRERFKIIGIEKIYATRVGKGDMPTYATDDFADVGDQSGEVGVTSGRKRRVGYPDWVMAKRGVMLNDCDAVIITRADCVQDREIKTCIAYRVNGIVTTHVPMSLKGVEPVYSGSRYRWSLWPGERNLADPVAVDKALKQVREDYVRKGFEGLPGSVKEFRKAHDEFVGCKSIGISIGPASGETVYF